MRELAVWLALVTAAPAAAEVGRDEMAQEALKFLGQLNHASALQPASCHGSFGVDVGAGMASSAPPPGNHLLAAQLNREEQSNTPVNVPRLWVTKGLPLPIDLGVSAGGPAAAGKGGFTQLSGHLQWTLYQALARPAAALRVSYGKLYGITGTALASTSGEAIVSYGFLRYFTLYGLVGVVQHRGELVVDEGSTSGYLLVQKESSWRTQAAWTQAIRAAGLKLQFGATLLALTGEVDLSRGAERADYALKVSYAL